MYRGITPTIILTFPEGTDFTDSTVYVSLSDHSRKEIMRLTGEDLTINQNVISLYLTQEQTLALPWLVYIQVNWTYGDGSRACSKIVSFATKKNLIDEVLQ